MRRFLGWKLANLVSNVYVEHRTTVAVVQAVSAQLRLSVNQAATNCAAYGGFGSVQTNRSWVRLRNFSSAAEPAADVEKDSLDISEAAVERLRELGPDVVLRVMVEGGGCSGFQYEFSLDSTVKEDDRCAAQVACSAK